MTIKVVCQCGATFGAKDELAGRRVACPKCKQPLKIGAPATPAPAPMTGGIADLLDEAGFDNVQGPRCPECAKPVQMGAMLCTNCGFNLQTGERVAGAQIVSSGKKEDEAVAQSLLNTAAERIANEKLEDKKTRSQGAPVWVYIIAFAGVLAFVACMLMIPRDQAFRVNGTGLMIFGYVIMAIYGIRMIIVAFMEDVICGLLWLFLPFYALYYVITRWSEVGSLFMMQLLGMVFVWIGAGMIALAPMMKMEEEPAAARFRDAAPPPVVATFAPAATDPQRARHLATAALAPAGGPS